MLLHKFSLSILILFTVATLSNAQTCNCESNFAWMKQAFEENDAGFQYIIDKKGFAEYEKHNTIFSEKVKSAKNNSECAELLNKWFRFFRKGHIGIWQTQNEEQNIDDSVQYYESYDIDTVSFKTYLSTKEIPDFEGIWESGSRIFIKKENDEEYIGITPAKNGNWLKVLQIFKTKSSIKVKLLLNNEEFDKVTFMGNNNIFLNDLPALTRLFPKYGDSKQIVDYIKVFETSYPYCEKLNNKTMYLRIPSFRKEYKNEIDSVIFANKKEILKTDNLIIDIRYNGGGLDQCWKEIIPLIYTNPIRWIGQDWLSTPLNNKLFFEWDSVSSGAQRQYKILSENIGKFVNLDSTSYGYEKFDTVFPLPKKAGIIINKYNASSAEEFLLCAKQSCKVKLFGVTTRGMLDFSNCQVVTSPCGNYQLQYAMTKSYRIPDMAIDDTGIQPDYYLDSEIPEYQWVDYVSSILNNNFE